MTIMATKIGCRLSAVGELCSLTGNRVTDEVIDALRKFSVRVFFCPLSSWEG